MIIDNSASTSKLALQTEIIKKSQDVVKNQIGYILDKNMENSKELEKKAAEFLGKGVNFNQKA